MPIARLSHPLSDKPSLVETGYLPPEYLTVNMH